VAREQQRDNREEPLQDRVVNIARVAKVVKGGRRFSFSALVVVGDGKDKVGFGVGKAGEVPDAIKKGSERAKKDMIDVPKVDGTIPYEVIGKYGSARVLMYPAKKGKGIIAGGEDIVCKVHGTKNGHNVVRATLNGLSQLMNIDEYAQRREKSAEEILV
jgi:small subunit ribosomal protein S5